MTTKICVALSAAKFNFVPSRHLCKDCRFPLNENVPLIQISQYVYGRDTVKSRPVVLGALQISPSIISSSLEVLQVM